MCKENLSYQNHVFISHNNENNEKLCKNITFLFNILEHIFMDKILLQIKQRTWKTWDLMFTSLLLY